MSEVTSFKFDDLHVDLLGNGLGVGCFDGEAYIDAQGAIVVIQFYGYQRGASDSRMVCVPTVARTDRDGIVLKVAAELYASRWQSLKEALNDWRLSLRERDYEAA